MTAAAHRTLDQWPVASLRGVGPALLQPLQRLGIQSVLDLLLHLPRGYEDRTAVTPMGRLQPGQWAVCEGVIRLTDIQTGRRRALLVRLSDGTGALTLRFFHFRLAQKEAYPVGARLRVYGEIRGGPLGPELVHPELLPLTAPMATDASSAALTPVYPLVEGLTQKRLRALMQQALPLLALDQVLPELLPPPVTQGWTLAAALQRVHAPTADEDTTDLVAGTDPAQQRVVLEELVAHQLGWWRRRQQSQQQRAPAYAGHDPLTPALLAALPFQLTADQDHVLTVLRDDLARPHPMLRLLQGDVGSGKTVVSALCACPVLAAGDQVALMAPTELLAEQHWQRFQSWFEPLGIPVLWLSGRLTPAQRRPTLQALAEGHTALVVGTQALFQEAVQFARLGLVMIDEQHRFGVAQRLALSDKGRRAEGIPHQLVMTATPIPRSLAMSRYGDLEVVSIRHRPPGRQPIQTVLLSQERRDELLARLAGQLRQGQQAYWVCTVIEDQETVRAEAATTAWSHLCAALPDWRIGLVHGQLPGAEKQAVMAAFASGQLDVLVATTVIEVGVDVPNATLMVIENPERLGLAQLHQLRGRVGRGSAASFCVLLYQTPLSLTARQRLQTLRDTDDGFEIAEEDLRLRGPGEVLGTRQTGEAAYRLAELPRDATLLEMARQLAQSPTALDNQAQDGLLRRWMSDALSYVRA